MKKNIYKILDQLKIQYDEIDHEPTTSCEYSKMIRQSMNLIWVGSKNIVFHCKWNFYIVVTMWEKLIKARLFKKEFWSKNIRFAYQEEIKQVINWTVWCIPSFGYKNEEIPIYVDYEIFENKYFMFNPDDPTKTIRLKTEDLKKIYQHIKNPVKIFKITDDWLKVIEYFI